MTDEHRERLIARAMKELTGITNDVELAELFALVADVLIRSRHGLCSRGQKHETAPQSPPQAACKAEEEIEAIVRGNKRDDDPDRSGGAA